VKLTATPESVPEVIAVALNLVPIPLLHTWLAFIAARSIMAASALGIFEALGEADRTAEEVAANCRTDPRATKQLLNCLVGIGYARWRDGKYGICRRHRKWLLRASSNSIVGKLGFLSTEWDLVSRLREFVQSGKPVKMHDSMSTEQWALYQDAMHELAGGPASEVATRLPMPRGATRVLDIGGSHGLYSVELCRHYPGLHCTILELPAAIDRAMALAARHGMAERLSYRAADVFLEDLGEATYDVVIANNFVHHFTPAQNFELAKKVARALTPGGLYAIFELLRSDNPAGGGMIATLDLYFALTSASGLFSLAEITAWQRHAGLRPLRPIRLLRLPGWAVAPAVRSAIAAR
jgi:2-polyprenyl-3-methyl-5-hydroxy-6-metoxy-1,4-benzoquinol methylase